MLGRLLILGAMAAAGAGQAELELVDGRILVGTDLRRESDVYVLTLESGDTIALPHELVANVRLLLKGAARDPAAGRPETLAGDEVAPPTRAEQLEVLGEPSRFQPSLSDSSWVPKSDWNMDPVQQNNFAPSTWSESPIDPTWVPESDWDNNADPLESSRSTWQTSGIDSTWRPTDGFADSVGRGNRSNRK